MPKLIRPNFFALIVAIVVALCVASPAFAAKHRGGGGGGGSCTSRVPGVIVDNSYAWATPGSWGMPGQQLTYAIDVINYDMGCGSSTFVVSMSAPAGFSVSAATSISLRSGSSGYVLAQVTSPGVISDGDYSLTATVQRTSTSTLNATASTTNAYKVYSSDTEAPSVYWPNPADGITISGSSYNVTATSSDDHAVQKIDLYIDGVYVSTRPCGDITYRCQLNYGWSPRVGQHTATFKSYDWMGNVGTLTVTFNVS
jgi:hypothetical protein